MSKIESGSTNVYADLGMVDAEEMLVKEIGRAHV